MSEQNIRNVMSIVRQAYEPSDEDRRRVYNAVIAAPLLPMTPAVGKGVVSLTVIKGLGATILAVALATGIYQGATHWNKTGTDRAGTSVNSRELKQDAAVVSEMTLVSRNLPFAKDVTAAPPAIETKAETLSESLLCRPDTNVTGQHIPSQKVRPKKRNAAKDDAKAASTNNLAAEIKLISQAADALNKGKNARARRLLDSHRSRFPGGVMAQERNGLETIVLCNQGKTEAALQRYKRLQKQSSGAPILLRVKKTCGFK